MNDGTKINKADFVHVVLQCAEGLVPESGQKVGGCVTVQQIAAIAVAATMEVARIKVELDALRHVNSEQLAWLDAAAFENTQLARDRARAVKMLACAADGLTTRADAPGLPFAAAQELQEQAEELRRLASELL